MPTLQTTFFNAKIGFAVALTASALRLGAAEWPQYHGPSLDNKTTVKLSPWPATGLKEVWRGPMTDGHSSITVNGGKAYTLILREFEGAKQESLLALDAATGKELWAKPIGNVKINDGGQSGTADNSGGDGPRSTPSIDGDKVYVLSAKLVLSCFGTKDGAAVWQHDLVKEYAGRNISWDNAASPLIEGNLVLCAGGGPGQSLLAFDKKTGELVWKGEDDKMTHGTPTAATIMVERQAIFFTQKGLVSVAPTTGKVLWRYDFPYNVSTAITPVVCGDIVFCSAGYHHTAGAAKLAKNGDAWTATEIWRQKGSGKINHWSTPIYKDGYLYGMFGFKEYGTCPIKCFDVATGEEKWSKPGFGPGNVILAGDKLLALSDAGDLVLIDPNAKEYKELARMKAVAGKCWGTPSIAENRIYVRSSKEGACFELPKSVAAK